MDFPKSVPGVGLVGGVFVDENAAIGRVGSLIPSAWGNAVTQEILAVIEAAGLQPAEAQTDQLLAAIRTLVPERSTFTRVTGSQALPAGAFGIYALADGGAAATVTLPSLDDLVDETELLVFAAHANTNAVQVKAAPAQTIQGPAALMSGSTVAFSLPASLGAWVGLRSEKDQGRWVVFYSYEAALLATTATAGIVELATNAEAQAGTDSSKAVTPAALAAAFGGDNHGLAINGYQKLPGGLIIQWGFTTNTTTTQSITWPIAFPNAFLVASAMTAAAGENALHTVISDETTTGATLRRTNLAGKASWIVIGY